MYFYTLFYRINVLHVCRCVTHHRIALMVYTMPGSMNKFSVLAHDRVLSKSYVTWCQPCKRLGINQRLQYSKGAATRSMAEPFRKERQHPASRGPAATMAEDCIAAKFCRAAVARADVCIAAKFCQTAKVNWGKQSILTLEPRPTAKRQESKDLQ